MSHTYTKLYSENNLNHNDISHSQYDICNDYRETFENNDIKTNKISFIGAAQAKQIKNNKTEENEEYLVAAQNTEEQNNYFFKKLSSNNILEYPSNKINSIFNDKNDDLKILKSYSRGNFNFLTILDF